jgi:glyoxylase-like metal-dependent hydrolase (beta-lactamase superfamily II)
MAQPQIASTVLPNVGRLQSQYFYSEPVGVYVIETPETLVLFDLPTYSEEIEEYLASFRKPIVTLLSHGSCGIADGTKWQQKLHVKVFLHEADRNHDWLRMKPDVLFSEPPNIAGTLEVIHTPGHSSGSVCLLDKATKTLFTGDTIYDTKDGKIRDFMAEKEGSPQELAERFKSTQKLLTVDFESILPFHYEMILVRAREALKAFISSA